jgi:hypothetical protein
MECKEKDCGKKVKGRGWCSAHYRRWQLSLPMDNIGAPINTFIPIQERFKSKYEIDENGCWLWLASLDKSGYGQLWNGKIMARAHRLSYEIHKGTIPPGTHLDHLCSVRKCVNPEHLEAVPQDLNNHRMQAMVSLRKEVARLTKLCVDNGIDPEVPQWAQTV